MHHLSPLSRLPLDSKQKCLHNAAIFSCGDKKWQLSASGLEAAYNCYCVCIYIKKLIYVAYHLGGAKCG